MRFYYSWLAIFIFPLYFTWLFYYLKQHGIVSKNSTVFSLPFSAGHLLKDLKSSQHFKIRRFFIGLRALSLLLLALACLRPQSGREKQLLRHDGIDIVLAVDTSGSMQALDLDDDLPLQQRRNRLQVVKDVMQAFVEKRPNDNLGLIVFGSSAFTQCPITSDHEILKTLIQAIQIGMAGDRTAIGMGLATAVKRLLRSQAKSKVIILLTDGNNNAGEITPEQAAFLAKTMHIKVYTIAAGTHGRAPFIVDTLFGKQVSYMEAEPNDGTLQKIADITSGTYFEAQDTRRLQQIYEQIDTLEKSQHQALYYQDFKEIFWPFVAAALFLLLLEWWFLHGQYPILP